MVSMGDLLDDDGLLDLRRRAKATDPAAVIAEERGTRSAPKAEPVPDALLRLVADAGRAPATPAEAGPAVATGMCPICKVRRGRQQCNSCHRTVCPADIWTMFGLCKTCATAQDVAHWHRPAVPETDNWLGGKP